MWRIASSTLALSLAVAGCGARFDRGTLPDQLSDDAFWVLVTELSVSRLFSRERPARLDGEASVDALFSAYQTARPSSEMFTKTSAAVRERLLDTHRWPLSSADLGSIEHALNAFYTHGPDINYRPLRPMPEPQPSYRALMTAADVYGERRCCLASDEAFRFIKVLHEKNLIVPVVGDFGTSGGAIARVGAYIGRHGSMVSAFYGSNVETYLSNQQRVTFCRSLADLPRHRGSAFILSKGVTPLVEKLVSCPRAAGS